MMTGFLTSTKERRQRPILAVRISDILCQPDTNQQDPKTLQALANRITQTGILQPFPVRKTQTNGMNWYPAANSFKRKISGLANCSLYSLGQSFPQCGNFSTGRTNPATKPLVLRGSKCY